MQIQTQLFCLQKTFVLQQAHFIGEDRIVLLLGLAIIRKGSRISLLFIKRKLVQTRIN